MEAAVMSLPEWAAPSEPVVIVLPRITEAQLRKAEDMLEIWAYENRSKDDPEVSSPDTGRGELLGRLADQGVDAMMSRGHDSGMGPIALECDQIIATLPSRKQRVLRLAYISFCSPLEAATRLKVEYPDQYWAEVKSARYAVAAKIDFPLEVESDFVVRCS